MKLLFNMNMPRSLAARMTEQGHQCRHVLDIGMAEAKDLDIMATAKSCGETIVTHDLDYGDLLAFSGEKAPSVLIVRLRNTHPSNIFFQIMRIWGEVEIALLQGAIVVLEDFAFRIRYLPIKQVERIRDSKGDESENDG